MLKPQKLWARRRFVACCFVLAVLASVSFVVNREIGAQVGTTTAVVGIAQTKDGAGNVTTSPTDAQVDAAVREAIALAGGLPSNVGPGKKIVIQPNMVEAGWTYTNPGHEGVCTHRQVVRTVINMCVEMGASVSDIKVCEGSAGFAGDHTGYTDRQMTRKSYKDCGFDLDGNMIDDETGVQLVDANDVGQLYPDYPGYTGSYNTAYVTRIMKTYLINRAYYLPNCVAQADVLIRVPVLKTHDLAGFTGAIKLAFGIAPSDIYHLGGLSYYKWNLLHQQSWSYNELETNARGMADMTFARPPDFVVVDGLVGITTGPTRIVPPATSPGKANPYMACILAGKDPVACDAISTLAIGYKISSIPGLERARVKGLGTNNPAYIEVRGVHVGGLNGIRRWFPDQPNSNTSTGIPGNQTPPDLGDLTVVADQVPGQFIVSPVGHVDADPGLCKGELYVDGVLVDSNHVAPYNTKTGTLGSGEHTITYTIYDGMLNETSETRTVTVMGVDPMSVALNTADSVQVTLGSDIVFSGKAPALGANTFFVSSPDGIRGLRVELTGGAPNLVIGQRLALKGTMGTNADGQRYLTCSWYSPGAPGLSVRPRMFKNRDLGGASLNALTLGLVDGGGPYNVGCLVKVAGKVSAGNGTYYWIDDGSLQGKLKVLSGTAVQPAPGSYVSVVGFSCVENSRATRVLVVSPAHGFLTHKDP